MEWFLGILLKVIINKFTELATKIFTDELIKKGIRVKIEKDLEHIQAGNEALDNGNLQGWLDELNNEDHN